MRRTKFSQVDMESLRSRKRSGPPSKAELRRLVQSRPNDFCKNVLGIKLWQKQQLILHTLFNSPNKRLAVPASFSVGKTYAAAAAVLFFLYNFPPAKVVTLAPTWRQVKNLLWRDIRKQHSSAKMTLGGHPITTELSLDEDWYAIGFSTQEGDTAIERITGIHSPNIMVVFDQAAGLDEVYWKGAKAILTSENSRWLALGNTAIYNSQFRKVCETGHMPGIGKWDVLPITAYDSPNVIEGREVLPGLVTKEWVEDMEELGEDDPMYRIFCMAEFVPDVDLLLIPFKTIAPAFRRQVPLSDTLRVGLDIANRGTDSTVWTLWSGFQLLDIEAVTGHITGPVIRKTKQLVETWQNEWDREVEIINGDANGVGAGVMDMLEEDDGTPIFRCMGSSSAEQDDRFRNFRAEQGWFLRELFTDGRIGLKLPEQVTMTGKKKRLMENLRSVVENLTYKLERAGSKILLSSKEELRPILGTSPDEFDSVMYGSWDEGGPGVIDLVTGTEPPEIEPVWEELFSPDALFAEGF